jgi:hypothetical protein
MFAALLACDGEDTDDQTPQERYCSIQSDCGGDSFDECMSWVDDPPVQATESKRAECLPLWDEHVECIAGTDSCESASYGGPCQASIDAWYDCQVS